MFVTYENRRNPHVTIHKATCTQIGKQGGGDKYNSGKYTTHGSFTAASLYAKATGLPVRNCSFCRPV